MKVKNKIKQILSIIVTAMMMMSLFTVSAFAKDNYTMLDNLKLGYGGTQEEMARLINDTGVLGDTFVTTGQKGNFNDVVTFDKVIEAIGIVQDRLGITGTTAKEAESTILCWII